MNKLDTSVDSLLTDVAYDWALREFSRHSKDRRKRLGQFATPIDVAKFMAERTVAGVKADRMRILDPAAGTGVLCAAVLDAIVSLPSPPRSVELVVYEVDAALEHAWAELSRQFSRRLEQAGVSLKVDLRFADFLDDYLAGALAGTEFDVVIANPPYFKLKAGDHRAAYWRARTSGQQNIYGLFMLATAELLAPEGRWCFLTPRSWLSGVNFDGVRTGVLRCIRLISLHLFVDRSSLFGKPGVLQEVVITWATKAEPPSELLALSQSRAHEDIKEATFELRRLEEIVSIRRSDQFSLVHTPELTGLATSLVDLGLVVKTGSVVPFRSKELLGVFSGEACIPLLWMRNVKERGLVWDATAANSGLRRKGASPSHALPDLGAVIIRRFSAPEAAKRVICSPVPLGYFGGPYAVENHLNVIRPASGVLSIFEAFGISAYLSSSAVDKYFRSVCSTTQINAGDIRRLPFPSRAQLIELGESVLHSTCDPSVIADRFINSWVSMVDLDMAVNQ